MAQTLRLSRLVRSGVALGVVFPLVVSLSAVAQTPPPDSVPSVELTRFEARTEGNEAILTWTTASETNNAGFSIERKRDDGSFERLAFKEGTGPTEGPQSYRFRTTALDPGVHTFRLRQENLDGSTTLSDTVSVEVRLSDAYEISSVRPNPVRSSATVSVTVRETQEVGRRSITCSGSGWPPSTTASSPPTIPQRWR